MNKNTNTYDRIIAATIAQMDEVWADTDETCADGTIGDLLDEISPEPRYDMVEENWEGIEDRLPDIDPDLDDEGDREFVRKAMAGGVRLWLLAHPAEVVAHLAESNEGLVRRDLDALREVQGEGSSWMDATVETIGGGYLADLLVTTFGPDEDEDGVLFDALYDYLMERV